MTVKYTSTSELNSNKLIRWRRGSSISSAATLTSTWHETSNFSLTITLYNVQYIAHYLRNKFIKLWITYRMTFSHWPKVHISETWRTQKQPRNVLNLVDHWEKCQFEVQAHCDFIIIMVKRYIPYTITMIKGRCASTPIQPYPTSTYLLVLTVYSTYLQYSCKVSSLYKYA